MKYNPGTHALAGAIIDQVADSEVRVQLLKSLNPVSVFNFQIDEEILKYILNIL
jgi:hypothetical protein